MASGYLRISNENIKRKSFISGTSDFNTYVLPLITPIKVYFNSQDQPIKAENNFFDKLIYLDKGTYRASDGATYADRVLNFPIALSCTNALSNIFEGTPFINENNETITVSIEFAFGGESDPKLLPNGYVITFSTIELTFKFQVSETEA